MSGQPEPTAVLVIRAWLEGEDDPNPRLRARVTSTLDVSQSAEPATTACASEHEVVRAVRGWLRAFVASR
jgi:hypothetical protein